MYYICFKNPYLLILLCVFLEFELVALHLLGRHTAIWIILSAPFAFASFLFIYFFWWYWGLNSGPHTG
jgi:hypothetical protein